jgi:glutamate/tyrosine decarboxylase-like PLP-dependent enzyme
MQDALRSPEELSPADLSPELTKHFRGLRLWLSLKLLGLAPFRACLEEKILLARYFYDQLGTMKGFERGPYPELSVVTYRYIPQRGGAEAFNRRLVDEIHQDGRAFMSSTMINGKFTLRFAALAFRTHLDTVDLALSMLKEKVKILER